MAIVVSPWAVLVDVLASGKVAGDEDGFNRWCSGLCRVEVPVGRRCGNGKSYKRGWCRKGRSGVFRLGTRKFESQLLDDAGVAEWSAVGTFVGYRLVNDANIRVHRWVVALEAFL